MDSIFLLGFSNGGMVSYEIAGTTLQGKISAILPQYSLPMRGGLKVPETLRQTSFLYMGGRADTLIPPAGEIPGTGWFYESYETCLAAYAVVNGCDPTTVTAATPFDGQDGLSCIEHAYCASGRRVMGCLYDAGHSWPSNDIGPHLTNWFLEPLDPAPTSVPTLAPSSADAGGSSSSSTQAAPSQVALAGQGGGLSAVELSALAIFIALVTTGVFVAVYKLGRQARVEIQDAAVDPADVFKPPVQGAAINRL
jgi:poly(3-hydroxybutyrate) depolymerase